MKKALFILSGNLSTTPRAVKVLKTILPQYNCQIVLINRGQMWMQKDQLITEELNLAVKTLQLGRNPFIPWFRATTIQLISRFIYSIFKKNLLINSAASNKSSIILWDYLKNEDYSNINLIFGFSSGSVFPTTYLSKKYMIKSIIDIEDYYPCDDLSPDKKNEKERREFILKRCLKQTSFITSASPLIEEYTLNLIGGHPNHQIILNSFPQNEFRSPIIRNDDKLKLVWFSQKISFGRGLEQIMNALEIFAKTTTAEGHVILTLIGDLDAEFDKKIIQPFINKVYAQKQLIKKVELVLHPPLLQSQLHEELANHDVGLALEFNKTDLNRQLCLTNKIIAYAQAGLYIFATDTPAQQTFMEEDSERGIISGQSIDAMKSTLSYILENLSIIKSNSPQRYNKGQNLSWNKEATKFINIYNSLV